MLINLSNHPSEKWTKRQREKAIKTYKSIVDVEFPQVSPHATTKQVIKKAERYFQKILKMLSQSKDNRNAVHLMGEFTFTFNLTLMLKKRNICVIASTTERIVEEIDDKKIVTFKFVRFREY